MSEIWKDIKGLEGKYQISNMGRVKSLHYNWSDSERMLIPHVQRTGYLCVNIGGKLRTIHRLVAESFIENPNNLSQVNHIDGNKRNNTVENLEWCSPSENLNHAYKIGLKVATSNHLKKRTLQFDLDRNLIKEWECTKDIERVLNINHSNISACCNGRLKTSGGYVWRYADDWQAKRTNNMALGAGQSKIL